MPGDDQTNNAIASLARDARTDAGKLGQLLAMTVDPSEDSATRRAALHSLQELGFTSVLLKTMNAQLIAALRSIIDDPDPMLREIAVEMLAQKKDELVQRRLLDGLGRRDTPVVDDNKAIQFLGYDIHAGQFPIVRKLARESPDPATRREAVKLLAADTESAELLLSIFDDKDEDDEVRRASGSALLSVAPRRFTQRAKRAVLDDSEVESVRVASLTALTHFASPDDLPNDREFIAGLSKVKFNVPGPARKKALGPADPGREENDLAKAVQTFKKRYGIA